MDDKTLTAILVGLVFGGVLGILTARSSHRRDTVHGGTAAQFFQYLGAAFFVGIVPMILCSVFFIHPPGGIGKLLLLGFGFALLSYGALLVYAVLERPAREAALAEAAHRGWTEEDARTSGL